MREFVAILILGANFLLAQAAAAQDAAGGVDYSKALKKIEADLATELAALAKLRAEIAAERPALALETEKVAAELRDRRRRSSLAGQERDALVHDLGRLSGEVRGWRDERVYIDSLLADFRRSYESQVSLAEAEMMRAQLLAADSGGDSGLGAQLALAEAAIARLGKIDRPRVVAGEALDGDGVARRGKFVEVGPVGWFVSDDGELAGLVSESRDLRPEVVEGVTDQKSISALAVGGESSPAFDPTLGTAVALEQAGGSLVDHIRKGGFWIYPILIIALVAAVAAVAKWLQLLRIKPLKPELVRGVLKAVNGGDSDAAFAALAGVSHPAGQVLRRGVEIGKAAHDDVEEVLYEEFLKAVPPLERGLPLISIASATAPLLGLLGTVTGMIHTFTLINIFGTGDAKSLSSGISEALVTTEFGLVVAIPALILHALLSRKIGGIKAATEMTSLAYVNGLKEPVGETE